MSSMTTNVEPFTCTNPQCGEANPPVLITNEKGQRLCFACGSTKGVLVHESAVTTLTAQDRCDRCSAQAYGRATMTSGATLLFCAHHLREHKPALMQTAVRIEDYSERLSAD